MDSAYNLKAGTGALLAVTTGARNNAEGYEGLYATTTGTDNVANGYSALSNLVTGNYNVALGSQALTHMGASGSYNIGLGYSAGTYVTTGSNNIYLGTPGKSGVTNESNVIRIGQVATDGSFAPHIATYVAGVWATSPGGSSLASVVVDSNGQLGVLQSSQRYKEDIAPMGDASSRLYQLRPVSFHYKKPDASGNKPIQYGLIAEEVERVFPELVVRNADGQPETVAYHLLGGLLLNELQKEHEVVGHQEQELADERQTIAAQAARLDAQAAALAAEQERVAAQAREIDALKQQNAEVEALRNEVRKLAALRQELDELRQVTAKLIKRSEPKAVKSSHTPTAE